MRQIFGQYKSFVFNGRVAQIWDRCHSSGDPDFLRDEDLRAYLLLIVEILPIFAKLRNIDDEAVLAQVAKVQKTIDSFSSTGG